MGIRKGEKRPPGMAKPPGGPWKPGQSGNPSGKPKTPEDVREALKALTMPAVIRLGELLAQKENVSVAMRAVEVVLERNLGKAVTPVLLGGENPLQGMSSDELMQVVRGVVLRRELSDGQDDTQGPERPVEGLLGAGIEASASGAEE
jgi:hypothetical protein